MSPPFEQEIQNFQHDIDRLKLELDATARNLQTQTSELDRLRSSLGRLLAQSRVAAAPEAAVEDDAPGMPEPFVPPGPQSASIPPGESVGPGLFSTWSAMLRERIGQIPAEEFIGINLLNKIGILILVIGAGFFLRIAHDWIGPAGKLASLFAVSLGAIVLGDFFYRRERYGVFGMGLLAFGGMLTYFSTYAAANIEATRVVPESYAPFSFFALVLISMLLVGGSLRYRKEALTSFAYFLSFLALSINETGEFNDFSMVSAAVLAASLVFVITKMGWKYLAGLGLLATYANFLLFAQSIPRGEHGTVEPFSEFLRAVAYLGIFWTVFMASTFSMRIDSRAELRTAAGINVANAFSFFSLMAYVRPEPTGWGSFATVAILGGCYVVAALLGRMVGRSFLWKSNIVIGVSLLFLAIPFRFSEHSLVFGWLVQGALLVALGNLFAESYLRRLGYLALAVKMIAFLALPGGDLIYGGGGGPEFSLDGGRGLMYVFMIVTFSGLLVVAARHSELADRFDAVAERAFAVLVVLSGLLFSYYSVPTPNQAIVLCTLALLLAAGHKLLKADSLLPVSLAMQGLATLTALPMLGKEQPNSWGAASLACLTLVGAGQFVYTGLFSTHRLGRTIDAVREALLWSAGFGAVMLSVRFLDPLLINPGLAGIVAVLLVTHFRGGRGVWPACAVAIVAFGVTVHFYESNAHQPWRAALPFLGNALVFWLSMALLFVARGRGWPTLWPTQTSSENGASTAASGTWMVSALLWAIVTVLLLLSRTGGPLFGLSLAAYSLGLLALRLLWKDELLTAKATLLFGVAVAAGPLQWASRPPALAMDIPLPGWAALFCVVAIGFAFLSAKSAQFKFAWREGGFTLTVAALFLCASAALPDLIAPSAYAFVALASLGGLWYLQLPRLRRLLPIVFAVAFVRYVGFLVAAGSGHLEIETPGRVAAGLPPLLVLAFLLAWSTRLAARETPGDAPRAGRPPKHRIGFVPLAGFALLVAFVWLTTLVVAPSYLALAWSLEAIVMILSGLMLQARILRFSGMALVAIALVKLGFWDLKHLDDSVRVVVLVCVGMLLVVSSYLYARFKDRLPRIARSAIRGPESE